MGDHPVGTHYTSRQGAYCQQDNGLRSLVSATCWNWRRTLSVAYRHRFYEWPPPYGRKISVTRYSQTPSSGSRCVLSMRHKSRRQLRRPPKSFLHVSRASQRGIRHAVQCRAHSIDNPALV